jgi:hypothetical protein
VFCDFFFQNNSILLPENAFVSLAKKRKGKDLTSGEVETNNYKPNHSSCPVVIRVEHECTMAKTLKAAAKGQPQERLSGSNRGSSTDDLRRDESLSSPGNDENDDLFLRFVRKVDDVLGIGQLGESSHDAWKREDRTRKHRRGIDGISFGPGSDTGIELKDIAATGELEVEVVASVTPASEDCGNDSGRRRKNQCDPRELG